MKALNLSAQPFRNQRLGEALFATGAALLVAVTFWHALVIRDLLPARTSALHTEVAALQTEERKLREEAATLRTEAPPAPTLARWNLVKELVDRRAFSWTGLFSRLEEVIPDDLRLTSISPTVRKGQVEIELTAVVRAPEAGWEFVRVLEQRGEFYDVYPTSEADREFRFKVRYRPQPRAESYGPPAPLAAGAAASPAPQGAEVTPATGAGMVGAPAPTPEERRQ